MRKKSNDSLSNPTRILVSVGLAFFATIVGKNNMSELWFHWCMLSTTEWENCDHEKGDA